MYGNATAVGLMVICTIVAVVVTVLQRRLAYRQMPNELSFTSLASTAGVAATASSLMYFAYFRAPNFVTLIAGDTTMVLAPALLWMALMRLSGRSSAWLAAAVGGPIIVGACTALAPQTASIVVKVTALAVYCALIVAITSRSTTKQRPGAFVIRAASAGYLGYCVLRLIALFVAGAESPFYSAFFAIGPTTLVSAAILVITAFGSFLLINAVQNPRSLPAPPSSDAVRVRVEIVDRGLIREAMGASTVDSLTRALITILAQSAHIVSVRRDGIIIALPALHLETVSAAISAEYQVCAKGITELPVNLLQFRALEHRTDADVLPTASATAEPSP